MALIHLTNEAFDKATASGLAMVDFWATWCGPCKMLSPVIESLADQYEGKVLVGKVNVDEEPDLARRFGVMSMIEKKILREAFADVLPSEIAWRQKEQFSDGVGYSWIDTLKKVTAQAVSDTEMANAARRFPINTPQNKEEYFYRTIFEEHFPSESAARSVPSVPSVACSTAEALAWDTAFKNMNDPSGRAVKGVHEAAY